LNPSTTQATVEEIFGPYGKIDKVVMITDRITRESRGFGFVYYTDVESATKAKNACNGMTIDGRKIRTDYSITLKPHERTPGKYYGRVSRNRSPQRSRSSDRDRDRDKDRDRDRDKDTDRYDSSYSKSREDRDSSRYDRDDRDRHRERPY